MTVGPRSYTVSELDALRDVMENKYLYGSYGGPPRVHGGFMSRSYREDEKVKAVEEMVRTAMIAGHTAEDYLAAVQQS